MQECEATGTEKLSWWWWWCAGAVGIHAVVLVPVPGFVPLAGSVSGTVLQQLASVASH